MTVATETRWKQRGSTCKYQKKVSKNSKVMQKQQNLRYCYEKQGSSLLCHSYNPSIDTMEVKLGVAVFFTKTDIYV